MAFYKNFTSGSYTLQSITADCQRCVNLIPQLDESGAGKAQVTFINTPGLIAFANAGVDPIRMIYTSTVGRIFAVSGFQFGEIGGDGTFTGIDVVRTHSGVISVTDNGQQMMMVDGPNGYIYTFATNTFANMGDENFHGGDTIAFQDGRFLFNQPGTQTFWWTDLYSTTIDGTSFAAAEGSPDKLISLLSDGTNIWLFGDTTTEVWYDQGDVNTPFTRVPGALIPTGCAATFSPRKVQNTIMWLAKDENGQGFVVRTQGYTANRVSTFAMEQEIQRYSTISDAESWTYQQDGHNFYVLTFPTAGKTWVFDTSTGLWHERAYTGDGVLEQALPRNHCFAFGKHLVGSYLDGNIYQMTPSAYTDAGNTITRLRRAPILSQENKRITYHEIQFDMQVGLGDGTTEPQAMLRFSDDSGNTWSHQKFASVGKIGEYKKRVIYRRLGQARNRVFELMITDPVPVFINAAYYEAEVEA